MVKIDMLRAFAAVARAGSLVDGAAAIGRTPSAVSMTLKNLEVRLGRPLFEGERKSRLTPLGEFVLDMAEREMRHFARTVEAIEDFAAARTGLVRIAAVPSYASATLPGLVLDFRKRHPGIRLDIRDMASAEIQHALDRDEIDLGIVSDAGHNPDFRRVRIGRDAFGLVIRASDPAARNRKLDWSVIADEPLIANPLCERIGLAELQSALAASPLRVHNTTTLLAMVRAGLGRTVLPQLIAETRLPGIAFVPLEDPTVCRELHLLSRLGDTPSPATEIMADFIEQRSLP